MGISTFRDRALTSVIAAGGLAGHKTQVGHELTRMLEAGKDADFRDFDHGRHNLEAFEAHQRIDSRLEPPGGEQIGHGLFATGYAAACVGDGHEAFLQNRLHGRMGQDEFAQVTHVGLPPVSFPLVVVAVLEQERLEPLTGSTLVIDGIGASAAEVADRLVGGFRDVDGIQRSGPMSFGQHLGITLVGLHLVAGLAGNFRGSDNDTIVAELDQPADQHEAAGTGFVAEAQAHILAVLLAQPGDELVHGLKAVADLPVGVHVPITSGFGNRDGDGVFVDIKSDVEYRFHWCVC